MASNRYRLGPVSAYAVAVKNGYHGTEQQWLESLSAYGLAVKDGFDGTLTEWLKSLHASDAQVAAYLINHPEVLQQINPMRGSVATMGDLPSSGNAVNDTFYVQSEKAPYTWTGTEWVRSGINEADYADILAQLKEKVETVTEPYGKNLFFMDSLLEATGWSKDGDDYYGPLAQLFSKFGTAGLPHAGTFKENTQYTISLTVRNASATSEASTTSGMRVVWLYTQGSSTASIIPQATDTEQRFAFQSAAGRTVTAVGIATGTGGADIWHIKNLQLEEGSAETTYEAPTLTAIDRVSRELFQRTADLDGDLAAVTDLLKEELLEWEQGSISETSGESTSDTSNSYIRTGPYDFAAYTIVPSNNIFFNVYFYDDSGVFLGAADYDEIPFGGSPFTPFSSSLKLGDVAPPGSALFRLHAHHLTNKAITPDYGASIMVLGPKNAELLRRILALEAVTEPYGSNLFDLSFFANANGLQRSGREVFGKGSAFSAAAGNGIPIQGGFKENTQYTVSLWAYTEAVGATGNGMKITVSYTDGTRDAIFIGISQSTTAYGSGLENKPKNTTAAGKTVKNIGLLMSGGIGQIWHVKDFQIEEGTEATEYSTAVFTAVDRIARADADYAKEKTNVLTPKVAALEEGTAALTTGLAQISEERVRPNLFDMDSLASVTDWQGGGGEYYGVISRVPASYPNGLPIIGGIQAGTQYTMSLKAYNETATQSTVSGSGLRITFMYEDGTPNTSVVFPRGTKTWTSMKVTSDPARNVKYAVLSSSGGGTDIWHVKEMQIEEGADATPYAPPGSDYDAVDKIARKNAGRLAPSGGDDTAAIMAALERGECYLGPGTFFVNGLDMPAFSLLRGSGRKTVVRFASGDQTYCVKLGQSCTIRDLRMIEREITSEANNRPTAFSARGNVGIYATFLGNDAPIRGVISGVEIIGFSYAGIHFYKTGGNYAQSTAITECYVHHCNIGLYLDSNGEYNRITGCTFNLNYYGVLNNGGNNNFAACVFCGNAVGMLMDETHFSSTNMAHGNVTACSFNHSNAVTPSATDEIGSNFGLKMIGVTSFENFTGCNFGSPVSIESCQGATFNGVRFGGSVSFTVSDTNMVVLSGCVAMAGTVFEGNNSTVRIADSYYYNGTPITYADNSV